MVSGAHIGCGLVAQEPLLALWMLSMSNSCVRAILHFIGPAERVLAGFYLVRKM